MIPLEWMSRASCIEHDPEMFHPNDANETAPDARRVCRNCPVINDCLKYALTFQVTGIWANTNEHQRRQIRERQGIVAERLPVLKAIRDGAT